MYMRIINKSTSFKATLTKVSKTYLPNTILKTWAFSIPETKWKTSQVSPIYLFHDLRKAKEPTESITTRSINKYIVNITITLWTSTTVKANYTITIANPTFMRSTQPSTIFIFKWRAKYPWDPTTQVIEMWSQLLWRTRLTWAREKVERTRLIHSMDLSCIYLEKDKARVLKWNQER